MVYRVFQNWSRNLTRRTFINRCQVKGHYKTYKTREKNVLRITLENYANLTLENAISFSLERKREREFNPSQHLPHCEVILLKQLQYINIFDYFLNLITDYNI